jgi:hypothetical protein
MVVALATCLAMAVFASSAAAASSAELPARFTRFPGDTEEGQAAGQFSGNLALATDPRTGNIFVGGGNRRIDEFTPWGTFIKAFGTDVSPGPVNERQEIRIRATGGTFNLTFEGSTTGDLPFDATDVEVAQALDALPSVSAGGGEVAVEKSLGNQVEGVTPTIYTVTFSGGPLAATDVEQLAAADGAQPLSGGIPISSATVLTQVNGSGSSTGLEGCTSESGCQRGASGEAAGEVGALNGIAADANGDIYVLELGNRRVQKFSSSGEFELMIGGEVDKTTGGNVCTAESGDECGSGVEGTGPGFLLSREFEEVKDGIAVGGDGTVYVADVGRIQEFEPDGAYKSEIDLSGLHATDPSFPETGGVMSLALSASSGNLYFSLHESEHVAHVYEIEPATGAPLEVLTFQFPGHGELEALESDSSGALDVAALSGLGEAAVVRFGLSGETLTDFAARFAAPQNPVGILAGLASNGFGDLYVSENGGVQEVAISAYGPVPLALAPPPKAAPTISDQYATAVGTDNATVKAAINPHFFNDTRFYVEYGTGSCAAGGCTAQPLPPGELLTEQVVNSTITTAPVELTGLAAGTTYHYRFVAESSGGGPTKGLTGQTGAAAEGTFTTRPPAGVLPSCPANEAFRPGPGAFLPDCRAYEMVSPVDKNGADISVLYDNSQRPAALEQVAAEGGAFTFSAYRAFAEPKSSPYTSQYRAQRVPGKGWEVESISPPRRGPAIIETPSLQNDYWLFTPDLCQALVFDNTEQAFAPGAVPGYRALYRRDICANEYEAIAPLTEPTISRKEFVFEPVGSSNDGSRVFIAAEGGLAEGSNPGAQQLYEVVDGHTSLVCILPNEKALAGPCNVGSFEPANPELQSRRAGAVSGNGETVYWSDQATGQLYVRLSGAATLTVSKPAAEFWGASPDGSRAVYSEKGTLKVFDLESDSSTTIAGGFIGLLGESADAKKLYLVSDEALAAGAVAGEPNLYLYQAGEPGSFTYIARLSDADTTERGVPYPTATSPILHSAQVSEDGNAVVFMSVGRPTGFNNTDAATGQADAEVYLYRAGGPLTCLTCSPSGARPSGADASEYWVTKSAFWVAGQISRAQSSLHGPRVISANGTRVFFETYVPLSARDANGQKDVYEWEASGAGNCTPAAEGFEASVGGCVNLISSGESPEPSEFLDSTADGGEAFFKTESSLLPQDPGQVDIYDAKEGGGFPVQPPVPESCKGEACQSTTSPPATTNPGSGGARGDGNVKVKQCPKGKRRVTKKGKTSCVKPHRKRHHKKHAGHHKRGHRKGKARGHKQGKGHKRKQGQPRLEASRRVYR